MLLASGFLDFVPEQWRNAGDSRAVRLNLSTGWKKPADAEITHWRIDEHHSNAYSVFCEMGSPTQPTPEQIQQIRSRMGLETVEPPSRRSVGDTFEMTLDLPPNAVSLIKIKK